MAQDRFFVSHNGQQEGPFEKDIIIQKISNHELDSMDYVFDDEAQDWILVMEHALFKGACAQSKPVGAPKPKMQEEAQEPIEMPKAAEGQPEAMVTEWYVLKGENKFGPFVYTDVVKMLQEKVVFEFDFVWNPGLSTWHRIADLEAFHPDYVAKLKTTLMPEISEVFFRRRHRRVRYGGTILVHDNNIVWKGKGVEISAGGAGVVIENAALVPGQTLYLHFKPGDGVPPFNAVCEVVSKKYVKDVKTKNAPIEYGLKFKSISANTQKFLQEFSKRGAAAA